MGQFVEAGEVSPQLIDPMADFELKNVSWGVVEIETLLLLSFSFLSVVVVVVVVVVVAQTRKAFLFKRGKSFGTNSNADGLNKFDLGIWSF